MNASCVKSPTEAAPPPLGAGDCKQLEAGVCPSVCARPSLRHVLGPSASSLVTDRQTERTSFPRRARH